MNFICIVLYFLLIHKYLGYFTVKFIISSENDFSPKWMANRIVFASNFASIMAEFERIIWQRLSGHLAPIRLPKKRAAELLKAITWLLWLTPGQKVRTSWDVMWWDDKWGFEYPASWKLRWFLDCLWVWVWWHLHLYRIMSNKHFRPCLFTLLRLVGLNVCVSGSLVSVPASVRVCICIFLYVYLWVSVSQSLLRMSYAQFARKVAIAAPEMIGKTQRAALAKHAIFAFSQKLTKINFSANNRIYTYICEYTCGGKIKTRPRQILWLVQL